jgi:hypothetical protein
MPVLAVLAGFAGLLLFMLSIPVDFQCRFASRQEPPLRCRIDWFFSLIKLKLPSAMAKKKPPAKKEKKIPRVHLVRFINRPLIYRFFGLVKGVFRSFSFRRLHVDINAGLGEPADTGLLFGAFSAVLPFITTSNEKSLRWTPDFSDEAVLKGDAAVIVRFRPIRIVPALLAFVFSKPFLQTVWKGLRQ